MPVVTTVAMPVRVPVMPGRRWCGIEHVGAGCADARATHALPPTCGVLCIRCATVVHVQKL